MVKADILFLSCKKILNTFEITIYFFKSRKTYFIEQYYLTLSYFVDIMTAMKFNRVRERKERCRIIQV